MVEGAIMREMGHRLRLGGGAIPHMLGSLEIGSMTVFSAVTVLCPHDSSRK
jgi:hypothetical protein